jgi:hypothetical protein
MVAGSFPLCLSSWEREKVRRTAATEWEGYREEGSWAAM